MPAFTREESFSADETQFSSADIGGAPSGVCCGQTARSRSVETEEGTCGIVHFRLTELVSRRIPW